MALSNNEVQRLIRLDKRFADESEVLIPVSGQYEHCSELLAVRDGDKFLLNVSRAAIRLTRCKTQTRYSRNTVLIRVEIDGPPHENPDGTEVSPSHVHIYREGYDDKWAYPIEKFPEFASCDSLIELVRKSSRYCGVVSRIPYQKGVI